MPEIYVSDVWENLDMRMKVDQVCECICKCSNESTESVYTCAKYWKFLCMPCTYDETANHFTCDLIHCRDCSPEFSPKCNEVNCTICEKGEN